MAAVCHGGATRRPRVCEVSTLGGGDDARGGDDDAASRTITDVMGHGPSRGSGARTRRGQIKERKERRCDEPRCDDTHASLSPADDSRHTDQREEGREDKPKGAIEPDRARFRVPAGVRWCLPAVDARRWGGLLAWGGWPFGVGVDPRDGRYFAGARRQSLADLFAAYLEAHVLWAETAPAPVWAAHVDDLPAGACAACARTPALYVHHYRYCVTVPAGSGIGSDRCVYTTTVWWTPHEAAHRLLCCEDESDDEANPYENDREYHGDGQTTTQGATSNAERDVTQGYEDGSDEKEDGRDGSGMMGLRIVFRRRTDDSRGDIGLGNGEEGKEKEDETDEKDRDGRGKNGDARPRGVDLSTAASCLYRDGRPVAACPPLRWAGSVASVAIQLERMTHAAQRVHAIMCFRPSDRCEGARAFFPVHGLDGPCTVHPLMPPPRTGPMP